MKGWNKFGSELSTPVHRGQACDMQGYKNKNYINSHLFHFLTY